MSELQVKDVIVITPDKPVLEQVRAIDTTPEGIRLKTDFESYPPISGNVWVTLIQRNGKDIK